MDLGLHLDRFYLNIVLTIKMTSRLRQFIKVPSFESKLWDLYMKCSKDAVFPDEPLLPRNPVFKFMEIYCQRNGLAITDVVGNKNMIKLPDPFRMILKYLEADLEDNMYIIYLERMDYGICVERVGGKYMLLQSRPDYFPLQQLYVADSPILEARDVIHFIRGAYESVYCEFKPNLPDLLLKLEELSCLTNQKVMAYALVAKDSFKNTLVHARDVPYDGHGTGLLYACDNVQDAMDQVSMETSLSINIAHAAVTTANNNLHISQLLSQNNNGAMIPATRIAVSDLPGEFKECKTLHEVLLKITEIHLPRRA